jgi:hypothetical protein
MTWGGALIAFIFYALTVAFDPVGARSLAWTAAYGVVFVAAGATCGWLSRHPALSVRYVAGCAVIGAVLWSYLAVTWPFTARSFALYIPAMGVVEAALLGGALGAAGGLLFLGLKTLQSAPDQASEKEKTTS